jgi:LPS-assembly protein
MLAALLACGPARAQPAPPPEPAAAPPLQLRMAPMLTPPRGDTSGSLPIVVRADEIRGRPDLETTAEGNVEFRRGGIVIRADRLTYEHADDLARASGNVRVSKDGNTFSGPELQLRVSQFEGFFLRPSYYFARTGAGGTAERFDFLDAHRAVATRTTYTSCLADGSGSPAWLLSTERVKLDFDANEGIAEGAVLRFYGVPILAAPVLSFPLSDARKSGWLPPSINIDNKSGIEVQVPYYWNIAPNRDATLTPSVITRRGAALDTEFRYLDPRFGGAVNLKLLPHDRLAGRSRDAIDFRHEGVAPQAIDYQARVIRVSDDEFWKDFPHAVTSLTPRLLPTDLRAQRAFERSVGDWTGYARVQQWQVLQVVDPLSRIVAPYQRSPQLGLRYLSRALSGFEVALESEFNRFTLPSNDTDPTRNTGQRTHLLGSLSRPFATAGWTLVPRLSFNAATYSVDRPLPDGRRQASRVIPTFSVDSGWVFERDAQWFGRQTRQTLEPRLLYVNTPFRDQSKLPNFDAAGRDFNFESIFSDNAFSGVDRVSDAHQLTAGVTTRLLDASTGAEALRLGIVQRYLFRDQLVTPEGIPFTQRFSDVLLLGSTNLVPSWWLDASVQYSPDLKRSVRSILGMRYSPAPFRTVSATYRLARDLTEQVELGWQWPLYGRAPGEAKPQAEQGGRACNGAWYSAGRINYSTRDKRVTDSVLGLEYDSGCWIGRIVFERLSTGRSEATTRLLLQLELVGLSRLGSNSLGVLKDNVPGYRLLREERTTPTMYSPYE